VSWSSVKDKKENKEENASNVPHPKTTCCNCKSIWICIDSFRVDTAHLQVKKFIQSNQFEARDLFPLKMLSRSKKILKFKKLRYSTNNHSFENWSTIAKKELGPNNKFEDLFTKTPEGTFLDFKFRYHFKTNLYIERCFKR
jgi:phosphorylcholine metabolism protein LicD